MADPQGAILHATCPGCGAELAPALLSCPACGALVHAEELKRLAASAGQAATARDELLSWRAALALLPPGSRQHEAVTAKVDQLCQVVDAASPTGAPVTTPPAGKGGRRAGGIAGLASLAVAFLAKFKFLILFLLTKGKLLLLGLTKASTLLTMLLSFGVYWSVWGWKFAAGFIVSIYVHEMGHVAMLHRFGIRATAPMFIPGFGAVVRLREALPTAREDARVGLAGPIWGTAAAVIAWGISLATGSALFAAIAKTGAWINLFNLTPVWQLDGSRAFRALTRPQRWIAVSVVAVAFAISQQQILLVLLALGVFRAFERQAATEPDLQALVEYGWLVAVLSALATVPTPVR